MNTFKRLSKLYVLLFIFLGGVPIADAAVVTIGLSVQGSFEPEVMPKAAGAVKLELAFTPILFHPEVRCIEYTLTVSKLLNLQFQGDSVWVVPLDSGEWYRKSIELVIAPNDTSGIEITIQCGRIPTPFAAYFVTTGDSLEFYRGNPRGYHPPEFRPWEHPIIDKEAFSNIDPNDRWYKYIDFQGNHIGYYHFTRERSNEHSVPLRFTHETVVNQSGIKAHFYRTFVEDDEYFTPQFLIYQGTEGNDTGRFTVNFANNTIQNDFDIKKLKKPKDCIVFSDLFEVVRNLPFDTLTEFECTTFDLDGNDHLRECRLKYLGTELVPIGVLRGEKILLHKFVCRVRRSNTYCFYLDNKHMVIIIQGDHEYMTLSSEAAATIYTRRFDWEEFEKKLEDSDGSK